LRQIKSSQILETIFNVKCIFDSKATANSNTKNIKITLKSTKIMKVSFLIKQKQFLKAISTLKIQGQCQSFKHVSSEADLMKDIV
jgi:hypothetical protein